MTKTATAHTPEETTEDLPKIPHANVKVNTEGFCWRTALVRLVEGLSVRDLTEGPSGEKSIWAKVQNGPAALKKFDRITAVTFDESTIVDAVVKGATQHHVHLAAIKINSFTQSHSDVEHTTADGRYRIQWGGSGYSIYRVVDDVRISTTNYQTMELAKFGLIQLYPQTRQQ